MAPLTQTQRRIKMYIMKGLKEWYESSPQTPEFEQVYDYYLRLLDKVNSGEQDGLVFPVEMNIKLEAV